MGEKSELTSVGIWRKFTQSSSNFQMHLLRFQTDVTLVVDKVKFGAFELHCETLIRSFTLFNLTQMQPLLFQLTVCVCSTLKPLEDDLQVSCVFVFTEVLTQNPSKSPNLAHTCHSSAKAIKPGSRPPAVSVKDSSWDDVSGHRKHIWCFSGAAGANGTAEATRRPGKEEKPEGVLEGVFMMFALLDGMW